MASLLYKKSPWVISKNCSDPHGSTCWLILLVSPPPPPTQAQYILIHQALLEHTQFGETENALQELHSTLNTLKQRSADNEPTLLEDEFEV